MERPHNRTATSTIVQWNSALQWSYIIVAIILIALSFSLALKRNCYIKSSSRSGQIRICLHMFFFSLVFTYRLHTSRKKIYSSRTNNYHIICFSKCSLTLLLYYPQKFLFSEIISRHILKDFSNRSFWHMFASTKKEKQVKRHNYKLFTRYYQHFKKTY